MRQDALRAKIEKTLNTLLNKNDLSKEDRDELRKDVLLAIKWESVKHKTKAQDWGSGFNIVNAEEEDKEEKEILGTNGKLVS